MTNLSDNPDPGQGTKNWRLLLSGGSHRAALGGSGAVLYMTQGRAPGETDDTYWDRVAEIISVSGGSILNSALLGRAKSDSSPDVAHAVQLFIDDMLDDRLKFYKSPKRLFASALMAGSVLGTVAAMLVGVGLLPNPIGMNPAVGFGIGLVVAWLAVRVISWAAGYYTEDAIGSVGVGSNPAPLATYQQRTKQHVICATGLRTMAPYYFWGGGTHFFAGGDLDYPAPRTEDTIWGRPVQDDFNLRHAAYASSSLPMLARLQANSERLIDGGASGSFGLQVSEGVRDRNRRGLAAPTGTADDWPYIIAIDAGVTPDSPSLIGKVAGKLFTTVRMMQWIKAENAALYEIESKKLIEREAKVLTIARDGLTSGDSIVDRRLVQLRSRNTSLKFHTFTEGQLLDAVLAGFVGMYVVAETRFEDKLVGNLDVQNQLELLAIRVPRLGEQLLARWQSLDSLTSVARVTVSS